MIEIKNLFTSGKMNKGADSRLMPDGEYRDALNIKLSTSQGSDIGAIENCLSTEQLTTLPLGSTVNTLGAFFDSSADMVYWFVNSNTGDYVIEYDTILDSSTIILTDTTANVLNFNPDYLITGVGVIVDTDSNKRILVWTDGINPIRSININTAKGYSANGFNDSQISLAKAPPLYSPTMVLGTTDTEQENNLLNRFLRFSYRYKYADGEVSAFSPFTETAFSPKNFNYDYSISSNESMENQYNTVDISFNTGVGEVVGIDILMKESSSSNVSLVQSFNKEEENWGNGETKTFTFSNNKISTVLPSDQLSRLYDAVPLSAKALELIGNRIVLGNYVEGYNIEDASGNRIKIDFSVEVLSTSVPSGQPRATLKSNRGYEVGIVYLDDYGRMTTVLTSPTNTTHVSNGNCVDQNKLRVTIENEAPSWATKYRFFLKQTRTDYETIVPSIFYQDGVYVWIKIEADEQNKFDVGDFIYVKSDSTQVLDKAVQTRVLELVNQEENFLEDPEDDSITTVNQIRGTYFKIKPVDFRIREEDFQIYENVTYGFRSTNSSNNFNNDELYYVEEPVYYGTTGIDDLSSAGTYTGDTDIRYIVDINAVGATDSFRWSSDGGLTYSADIAITGGNQVMEKGITVKFDNVSGHSLDDNWILSAKSGQVTINVRRSEASGSAGTTKRSAIMHYAGKQKTAVGGETIKGGANITIVYDDTASDGADDDNSIKYTQSFNATRDYANLEEWFYGDNIIDTLQYPTSDQADRVIFRRGEEESGNSEGSQIVSISATGSRMNMCFMSKKGFSGGERVRVNKFSEPSLTILELNNNIIFETIPVNDDSQLFFEVGRTYEISNGLHRSTHAGDVNQTSNAPAELTLPVYNAFAWGNAFESYKIKDLFNEKSMKIDSRPSGVIQDYRQNNRIADLTYSKPFEKSTNYNGINEFNLSTANFMQMDDRYGSIQKLFSAETNLEVYQEDKIHNVLYSKDVLLDADGEGNIKESTNVLGGTPVPWSGEYGISKNPESHASYGNSRFFTDARRGVLLRRGLEGITEITSGMEDFLSDSFRLRPDNKRFGSFDLRDKEYVIHEKGVFTTAYSNLVTGYPSFYSFSPEWMGSLNNKFYSFKGGQLHRHYDESNPIRNNFYGTQYESTIKLIMNEAPSDIKVLKAINIEGNKPWSSVIKSYLNDENVSITQTSLSVEEFLNKEGKFYAYLRRNELEGDYTAKDVYGIGEVQSSSGSTITIKGSIAGTALRVGDDLYNSSGVRLGEIQTYSTLANTVTLTSSVSVPTSTFLFGKKDGRVEGSEIRGYNFEIDLIDSTNTRTELFALNGVVFKSWPS
ncbi:structural protein [Cellulophaga phage Calle_1]|uniref:Structural protein n=1 Tax=Cellulophaga phage Calle_1 TaxID=2745643 RepID=A0A8E5E801_9CAUD|nr:virion structural protein [Cellulophaga phage Calle_1]QQV89725.1 structural protein [Cellulophaga phage Calle_1]QQV89779.1 structural protein [Cellulophaga phage Calle_2]QQV89940.1 structural protein [Cellulophaga phage Calle_3]